jgi:hypothetical protein
MDVDGIARVLFFSKNSALYCYPRAGIDSILARYLSFPQPIPVQVIHESCPALRCLVIHPGRVRQYE